MTPWPAKSVWGNCRATEAHEPRSSKPGRSQGATQASQACRSAPLCSSSFGDGLDFQGTAARLAAGQLARNTAGLTRSLLSAFYLVAVAWRMRPSGCFSISCTVLVFPRCTRHVTCHHVFRYHAPWGREEENRQLAVCLSDPANPLIPFSMPYMHARTSRV